MTTPELLVLELDGTNEPKILELSPDFPVSSRASLSSLNEEHRENREAEDEESLDMIEESDFEDDEAVDFDADDDDVV